MQTFYKFALIFLISIIFCASQKPFTALDNHKLKRVGAPVASPSGKFIVYTVRQWDSDKNIATTFLNLLNLNSGEIKRLTFEEGKTDRSPVWTGDEQHVLFLSSRGNGVWSVNMNGEVKQVLSVPVPISDLKISQFGKYLTFSAEVYLDCPTLQCTADRDAKITESTPRVYTKLYVRHWDRWETEGKMRHIFMVRFEDDSLLKTSEPIDIMKGMSAASPNYPFGGPEMYDISPDGSMIAFTAELINEETAWKTGWRTYVVKVSGGSVSAPEHITTHTQARTNYPVFSPDNRFIAYVAMDRPGYESDRYHIEIYDTTTSSFRKVANNWDRSVDSMIWTRNGESLLVTAQEDGHTKLFLVNVQTENVKVLVGNHTNHGVTTVPNSNTVLLQRTSYKFPDDIWRFELISDKVVDLKQITNENPHLSEFHLSNPERFIFKGANDDLVHSWIFKPIGWKPGQKYPMITLIHGGPQGAWNDGWSYRWNPQLFVSHGYAVTAINFHGSTGFGQAFTDSVRGDWGGKPYEDILKGVDAFVSSFPWIDGSRIGAAGASFGGYMINWINGHTNRFKALVNHDGTFDTIAKYFVTDELFFNEWEFKGTPWENPTLWTKWNPREYVQYMKTPTLIIHGSYDFRVPIGEALATFTGLQRRGIPSKLLHFPTENHWVTSPLNSIEWYKQVLSWFDKYLK